MICYDAHMLWFWLSIASVILFTAVNLLMRVLAVKSEDPRTFSVVFNAWGGLFALILFLPQLPHTAFPAPITPVQYYLSSWQSSFMASMNAFISPPASISMHQQ